MIITDSEETSTGPRSIPEVIGRAVKQVFCLHVDKVFLRNVYGDEINLLGGIRSEWKCTNCKKILYSSHLKRDVEAV